ncbi:Sas10/Utp3/C1D family [Thalictrum thalictroides]|uniref:Nuclear nucleic acid-binding protein C1D n=1 Tax=Thalictrum thalictroides TaxID=46969 RepID=A0A7J6UZC1_THATH|nr:Sas10/Utp3/C1D family [Thalictrum thalictroides]
MKESNTETSELIPESVIEAANKSATNAEDLKLELQNFLSMISEQPQILSQMPPLQRAQSLLVLARASSVLVALRLKCNGHNPSEHPVKTELVTPLRPSTTLNYQAATRFIEHSLPDLTDEQKKSMRNISRGEAVRSKEHRNAKKKRKVHSEKQSVRAAAQEFLEKATQELLGANKGDIKGPLSIQTSDGEDQPMD